MVINDGFIFTNQVREYCLENKELKNRDNSPSLNVIKSTGSIKKVTYNLSDHIALIDILSVNITDDRAILNYISKYGPLFLDKNRTDNLNEVSEEVIDINHIKSNILLLQCLVNLITSLQKQDDIGMVVNVAFLLLTKTPLDERYAVCFRRWFHDQSKDNYLYIYGESKLNQYIDYMITLLKNKSQKFWLYLPEYDQCLSLINYINNCFDVNFIEQQNLDSFHTNVINNITRFPHEALDILKSVCIYTIETELNNSLYYINPRIKVMSNGKLTGDWYISDLYIALCLDIYLSFASDKTFRKCINPTCNQYFEVDPGDTRKKYCSPRCAQLMAKRKQREREKAKREQDKCDTI